MIPSINKHRAEATSKQDTVYSILSSWTSMDSVRDGFFLKKNPQSMPMRQREDGGKGNMIRLFHKWEIWDKISLSEVTREVSGIQRK